MSLLWVRWLLVYMLINCRLKADDDFPWATAKRVLAELCPSTDICGHTMGWNRTIELRDAYSQCCSACSCDESCEETGDCCFPRKPVRCQLKPDRQKGKCMHPRSKYQYSVIPISDTSFPVYIVDSPPANGCVIDDGPGCQGDDVLRLHPVSSRTTGTIYFNKDCARCHGELAINAWKAMFNCDPYIDMMNELTKYVNDPNKSPCFFSFFMKDNRDDSLIKNNLCYIKANVTKSDATPYEVEMLRAEFGVTYEDMTDLCFSNLTLPYFSSAWKLLYTNPFCYLYDGGMVNPLCEPIVRSFNYPLHYSAFIDYKKVTRFISQQTGSQRSDVEYACYQHEGNQSSQNESRPNCRPLHCPISHVLNKERKCDLITNLMVFTEKQNLSLQLRLIANDKNAYQAVDVQNLTLSDVQKAMPWPATWRIIFVGFEYNWLHNDSRKQRGHDLFVSLFAKFGKLRSALEDVKRLIALPVILPMNGKHVVFSQHINRQAANGITRMLPPDRADGHRCFITELVLWLLTERTARVLDFDTVCWRGIYVTVEFTRFDKKVMLTNLHFCQQVELTPSEFTLMAFDTLLIYAKTGAYFYDNEFRLIHHGMHNVTTATVCSEDVGFVPVGQGSGRIYDSCLACVGLTIYVVLRSVL